MEYELSAHKVNRVIPPKKRLESIDLLLIDEAEIWVIKDPEASRILNDESPTTNSVTAFKRTFDDRFPGQNGSDMSWKR